MSLTSSNSLRQVVVSALVLTLAFVVTACSGGSGGSQPTPPRSLVSIQVSPASPSVAAGLTQQFTATGRFSDASSQDLTRSVTWTSGTASVATIDANGLATSKVQGSSLIIATAGSVTSSVTLNVTAPTLVSFTISPPNAAVQIGAAPPQFHAIETYTDQSTKDDTATATWSVSNPWIASIDATGAATMRRSGYTAVGAVSGTLSASANFTVLAMPRYLYVSSGVGRDLTRMALNADTGQPRFLGYQRTGNYNNIGSECLTVDPAGQHAYLTSQIVNPGGSGYQGLVNVYDIDPASGKLTLYPLSPFTFPIPVGCMQFEPGGNFAYATAAINDSGNYLATFSFNSNGAPSAVRAITLPSTPDGLAIDPLGQFLFVAAESTAVGQTPYAYGYAIDPTSGNLTPVAGTPFPLPTGTYGYFSFHPSGNYVYLSDFGSTVVSEYTINRTSGMITPVASSVVNPCINPSVLRFSPSGANAYLSCGETIDRNVPNAPLVSFSVGSGGQLTQIATAVAGPTPGQMVVDPSGKWIYLLGSGKDYLSAGPGNYSIASNSVMIFQVGSDGTATLVNQIAGRALVKSLLLIGGSAPVTWTPAHAYVTSAGDNKLTSYAVQANGGLSALQSSSITAGTFAAAMLPWGSDLLLGTSSAAPNVTAYAVADGAFTPGTTIGLATQPGGLTIDPSGTLAFGSDASTGLVYEYGNFGVLPGSWSNLYTNPPTVPFTYAAQAGAGPVTTDPAGRYLIVANQTAKSISLFEPAGAAPALPLSLSYTPLAIAVDPTGNWLFVSGDDQKLHLLASNGLGQFTDSANANLDGLSPSIAIDPQAHFVYAAGSAGLNAFSIDAKTLTLTSIPLNLPLSLTNATGVYIDPSGQFLYVPVSTNQLNALYRFDIHSDGTLSSTGTPLVASPNHAISVLFDAQVQ